MKKIIIFILFFYSVLHAENKIRLVILDLEPKKLDKETASMVSDLLRTELFNTKLFNVLERNEMQSLLKEQEFQLSGCTETKCAVTIGKLVSANKILIGTVGKLGVKFIINARIVDVEKGNMDMAEKVVVNSESELDVGCKMFADRLSIKITEYLGKKEKEKLIKESQYKVQTYLSKGIDYYKADQLDKAIEEWKKVFKLESGNERVKKYINRAKYKQRELEKLK